MEHYISKSALVAEIEKRIKETESMQPKFDQFWAGNISAFKGILKILDTLEMKRVDLDAQDIYNILILERFVLREVGDEEHSNEEICKEVLKRFNAQKGEKV